MAFACIGGRPAGAARYLLRAPRSRRRQGPGCQRGVAREGSAGISPPRVRVLAPPTRKRRCQSRSTRSEGEHLTLGLGGLCCSDGPDSRAVFSAFLALHTVVWTPHARRIDPVPRPRPAPCVRAPSPTRHDAAALLLRRRAIGHKRRCRVAPSRQCESRTARYTVSDDDDDDDGRLDSSA